MLQLQGALPHDPAGALPLDPAGGAAPRPPQKVQISDFQRLAGMHVVWKGQLSQWSERENWISNHFSYPKIPHFHFYLTKTIMHFTKMHQINEYSTGNCTYYWLGRRFLTPKTDRSQLKLFAVDCTCLYVQVSTVHVPMGWITWEMRLVSSALSIDTHTKSSGNWTFAVTNGSHQIEPRFCSAPSSVHDGPYFEFEVMSFWQSCISAYVLHPRALVHL